MDEFKNNGVNQPQNNSDNKQGQTDSAQNSGFYSYKYPNTANSPEYSATTSQPKADSANGVQENASNSEPHKTAQSAYSQNYASQTRGYSQNPQYNSQQSAPNAQGYSQGYSYSPYTAQSDSSYHAPAAKPVKQKKDKRKYPISAVIASCLACAVIASGATTAGVLAVTKSGDNSSSSGSSNTVINVDKSSSNAISAVAQKVIPSVVGIQVTASTASFFGMSQDSTSEGSGVVYTSDGYIITNYHVISSYVEASNKSSAKISVYLANDTSTAYEAKVIGYNSESDLAVIKIEKTGLDAIEFADSDKLEAGDLAVAVGNPGGLDFMSSVSSGIISGLNRSIKLEGTTEMKVIQTDAAINPGNSGGALCDDEGKLVGINSSKISSTDYEGMGFAIPSNYVKTVVDNIINNKDEKRAYLGVKISTDYDADTLQSYGYPAGAVVESVDEDSPAYNAGIRQSDIITSFNGVDISDYSGYNKERLNHKPGDKVTLKVYRNGRYYNVSLTLGESTN